jgi:hypothetical protein
VGALDVETLVAAGEHQPELRPFCPQVLDLPWGVDPHHSRSALHQFAIRKITEMQRKYNTYDSTAHQRMTVDGSGLNLAAALLPVDAALG